MTISLFFAVRKQSQGWTSKMPAAAERLFGPDRSDVHRVQVNFDWEVPSHANDPLMFHLNITRGAGKSAIRFQIDLARLAGADLQRLHDLLAERPKGYRLTFEIA
jgi:hypothetical protein